MKSLCDWITCSIRARSRAAGGCADAAAAKPSVRAKQRMNEAVLWFMGWRSFERLGWDEVVSQPQPGIGQPTATILRTPPRVRARKDSEQRRILGADKRAGILTSEAVFARAFP